MSAEIYKPQEGERVRVVYEGVALGADTIGLHIEEAGKETVPILFEDAGLVSIEKLEPAVEAFGPGDVVREKCDLGQVRVLAVTGYINLDHQDFYAYGKDAQYGPDDFTSDKFEKVALG